MKKYYVRLFAMIISGLICYSGFSQTGACCRGSGSCVGPVTYEQCKTDYNGKIWLKNGVCPVSGNSPCEMGACCTSTDCLPNMYAGECSASGGNFIGPGNCDPTSPNYACGNGRLQIVSTLAGVYSTQTASVQLQWDNETSFSNGTQFNIERSRDGVNYKMIGIIENNNNANGYTFIDNYPLQTGYYRIRFLSLNGKSYSQTINVVSVDNDKLYLMPNPATTTLRVLLSNMQSYETTLSVHDLSGRQVRSYKLNKGQNEISVSELPQGSYIIKANMNGKNYTSRFVKN